MTVDLAIENARIVDGTGAPWFEGSVGVTDGEIVTVTRRRNSLDSETTIDADGNVVCPGFIDTHSHSDLEIFADPTLEPKLRQGITTEVLGQDGFSIAPVDPADAPEWRNQLSGLAGDVDVEWSWETLAEYMDAIDENGVGPNVATLVGHGTVRFAVLGMDDRNPTEDELEEMADLVTAGLENGAIGFSTGLIYPPHVNAETPEVQALAERLEPYGRPFVAHIRSEGRWIWDALDEFVDIGAEADVPIHLSHYKVSGSGQHGKADRTNTLIEVARDRGVDFTAEVYPYTAGNTILAAILPPWVQSEDQATTLERLEDPSVRERIRRDIEEWRLDGWENPAGKAGLENIIVRNITSPEYDQYDGMDLVSIGAQRDQHPIEAACDILVAEELEANIIAHGMAEGDVREILTNERVCLSTDGIFGAAPHPRTYGTYPRVLGHYVREENLFSLEEAVRKMTSLPARILGLQEKGLVREGMDADLVVFDPIAVGSPATFEDAARDPTGIDHVIVDGTPAISEAELTGETPGRTLRG